jgi:hypothetical protein
MHVVLDFIYSRNIIKINLMSKYLRMNDIMYRTCTHVSV